MLTVGKKNRVKVTEVMPMGVMAVSLNNQPETVFVPYAQQSVKQDDILEVFVYFNEDGDLQGSLEDIKLSVDQFASLKVKSIIKAGAFLEWQLKPDLFMPRIHMHNQIHEHMAVVVTLLKDPFKPQLIASSQIEKHLASPPTEFNPQEQVELLVYAETPLGFKAIVNQSFAGLLYKNELFKPLRIGQKLDGFIKHIREDGKVDLQLQRHDKKARKSLADAIIDDLQAHGGISSLTDKSSPEDIQHRFNVSKGAYKKAIGELYKSRKILIEKDYIKLAEK
ncbi:CvfB family protein [Glaciecola sp. 1036]|uniref:CvfB family protein n=1 Tax=Alteromonadaceae TaxID=72275 RepID=UPI003D04CDC5